MAAAVKRLKCAQYQVYKDGAGEWRGRLVARNGRTVFDSGEGYKTKAKCVKMANKYLGANCTCPAPIEIVTLG